MRRFLIAAAALLLASAPAGAQTPGLPPQGSPRDSVAREAMALIRSPFFVAHTMDMCPNPGSEILRDSIRLAAASGMTRDQIVDDFIARHGENLRLLPRRSGFGLWAWLAPPGLLLLGLGFVAHRVHRMRGPGRDEAPPHDLTDEEQAQLAAALRGYEAEGAGT